MSNELTLEQVIADSKLALTQTENWHEKREIRRVLIQAILWREFLKLRGKS